MEALLARLATQESAADQLGSWVTLIDAIRPSRPDRADEAARALTGLTRLISDHPEQGAPLRTALIALFTERKQVSLYVSSGLLPSTGFFTEMARRVSHRLLPDVVDTGYLKDLLAVIFHRRDDEIWVDAVASEVWVEFFRAVLASRGAEELGGATLPVALVEMLEALRVLSYHVSAIGLEPELVRVDPQLEAVESPFLAQNAELVAYLHDFRTWWQTPETPLENEAHFIVMLDQCNEVLQRLRRRATRLGTSLTLTFTLERLRQHLQRINALLSILRVVHETRRVEPLLPAAVTLFKRLVRAECRKNYLSDYWSTNVELLSLRMTESASKTGEHYITTTRNEYLAMLGSAAVGGFVIAFMAAFKIMLSWHDFAPLTELLGYCLNYGLGFVFIHIVGGTVATKQPAMTANAIAASIEETKGKTRNLDNLAEVIVRMLRSQFAAIIGNLCVAVSIATLFAIAFFNLSGEHFVDMTKADHLLDDASPLSGAPFFAAVAGVCLFLAGLIAAYYDNLAAYNNIPQRLAQLRWARKLFGLARTQRIAAYIENNLGALAGNFFFGFLLGGATAIGVLFGLPLDIRHIAFSSAYIGFAFTAHGFSLPASTIILALSGVLLIGAINLLVSYTLALYVAMRSRSISFSQGGSLALLVLRHLLKRPQDFFFPPPAPAPEQTATEPGASARQSDDNPPTIL
ncbi:recombinase [Betaproteobacteria bacterium]|nr:recombinase [Betaproteobacteria bacterium]GHU23389.1 recombinase [Betaproteobacteria bacterium]